MFRAKGTVPDVHLKKDKSSGLTGVDKLSYPLVMNDDIEQQWAFIEARAAEMGIKRETIFKWRKRGVAHRYRLSLASEAAAMNFALSPVAMEGLRKTEAA